MSEFVYLFRGGQPPASPEQQMQRWVSWIKALGEKGHLKDEGRPLARAGKLVKGSSKQTVADGPHAEADGYVGGYMVIEATDLAHAVELSDGCPMFLTGGFVEVRPVMKM